MVVNHMRLIFLLVGVVISFSVYAVPPGQKYVDWVDALGRQSCQGRSCDGDLIDYPYRKQTGGAYTYKDQYGRDQVDYWYSVRVATGCPVDFPEIYWDSVPSSTGFGVSYDNGKWYCVKGTPPPPPSCPAGQEFDPDGVCRDTSCPDGMSGNFVRTVPGGPWSWRCFVGPGVGEPLECLAPSYFNNFGECKPPQDMCYTDFESNTELCVEIGASPDPELEDGCIVDELTGHKVCLSENEGCYISDGREICFDENKICGYKNGVIECVAHTETSCGYFNGEVVCLDPNGKLIDPNSPDHPNNGGNGDGNPHNDPTDPRPPEQGGNPDNQPGRDPGLGDAVGYLRDISRTNKSILDAVKGIPGKEILDAIKNIPGGGGGGGGGGTAPGDGSSPGDGDGDDGITRNYGKLETVVTDVSEQVEEVQGEYSEKLTEIKNQVRDMFSLDLSSGGTTPDRQITLFGVEINSSLSRFLPDMSMIPSIILAVAAIASALIIFGGRK